MSPLNLDELNDRFGISRAVVFRQGPGGMAVAEINNDQANAKIVLQGAHMVDWTPRGQEPVLWLSPASKFAIDEPIRGGVPICWPWFGPHPGKPDFPAHGYARTGCWEIIESARREDGATCLSFRLIPSEANLRLWPRNTSAEIRFTVGKTLEIELASRNLEVEPIVISQALHAYFRVADVRRVEILGLDGLDYIDKVDEGLRKRQVGPVDIASEVDRIYLDSSHDCLIDDPGLGRRISISKRGSKSTIIWNPWIEKASKMADMGGEDFLSMVCVESANAADDEVTLPPGAEHRLWVRYSVDGL